MKHYKFTDKQHSLEGILSTLLSIFSLFLLIMGIIISYNHEGNAGAVIGVLGLLAFIISIIGFFVGIHSFKKDDMFYLFSYVGAIMNTIIWFVILCIFMVGI